MERLAITICATKKYTYAMKAQARRVQAAIRYAKVEGGYIILAGDESKELQAVAKLYKELLPEASWTVELIPLKELTQDSENYKPKAQLIIAQLRTAAFSKARSLNSEFCWSLDSDVLPPIDALVCMRQTLDFANNYYSIATCLYPTQGAGRLFLGGHGDEENQIFQDHIEEERIIPDDFKQKLEGARKSIQDAGMPTDEASGKRMEELHKALHTLQEKAKEFPPKGDVYLLNSNGGWRLRGWFDYCYPAVGKGAIVPIKWIGFGCCLLNKEALGVCWFDGYDGGGTEDLYITWNRWAQRELNIAAIPHCLCDHVSRNPGKPGYYIMTQAYHEYKGICKGHLRTRFRPWYSGDAGEKWDEKNDAKWDFPKPEPGKEGEMEILKEKPNEISCKPKPKIPLNNAPKN